MIQNFPMSQAVTDIIAAGPFSALYAVELFFQEETVRAHTGTGELILDGQVYYGVGELGEISAARESNNASGPMSVELTLNGLDSDMIRESLVLGSRGREGRLMFVVLSESGEMAADILFSGRMDAARFNYGGNGGDNTITVPLVDRMAEWSRQGTERWTDENHQLRHSGDRFFYAIAQIANWPIYWGSRKDAPSFEYS